MKKVLCAFFLMVIMAVPAFAKAHLYTRHISGTKIENGEANYRDAQFERFKIEVWDDDTNTETPHSGKGTLTLSGGSYTYIEAGVAQTVNNTEKAFELNDNSKSGGTLSYKLNGDFRDAADTGLNGVTAKWTFATSPDDGEGVIPTFTSTEGQLKNVVPYVKLTYDSSNNVTAVHWAIVKSNDTGTPVAVDYDSRIDVKVIDRDDKSTTLVTSRPNAGTVLSGDIKLENALAESSIEYFEVSVRNRTDPNNLFSHEWRFFLPPYPNYLADQVHLWPLHYSRADIVSGEANYDKAKFERVDITVDNGDIEATTRHIEAKGVLSLDGGKYTYQGGTVNGTEKSFDLGTTITEVGHNGINYITMVDAKAFSFTGSADTGLNGVKGSWSFDATASILNGSGTIPNFTSTAEQLANVVPYIRLTSADNSITAVYWAVVKSSDTSTPVSVNYPARIRIRAKKVNDDWETLQKKTDYTAGTIISGDATLASALVASSVQYLEVSFRNRADNDNPIAHEWLFYPAGTPNTNTDNDNSTNSSGGGCNAGFAMLSAFALAGALFMKKR